MSAPRAGSLGRWAGVVRPCALRAPAVAIMVMAALLAVLARTTGSGWLVVMASGLVPLFVIGAVAPLVPLTRARVGVRLPPDGVVGRAAPVAVRVAGRSRGMTLRLREPASGWMHVDAPARGTVPAVPSRRGVVQSVVVELRGAGPFGLVTWQRRVTVPCDPPLAVAPVPLAGHAPSSAGDPRGEALEGGGPRRGGESVRGIRPYAPGDPSRLVHWPATARWGAVMVRELDDDEPPRLVVVVDLRTGGSDPDGRGARASGTGTDDAVELVASRASGLVEDALGAGRRVVLATAEPGRAVTEPVGSPVEAGRRLARAVAGEPVPPPGHPGDVVVRLSVTDAPSDREDAGATGRER